MQKNKNPKLLDVRLIGDKHLSNVSEQVTEITPELQEFIANLTHTMYLRDGVGLAAPQVGVNLRIFVIDPSWTREGKKHPQVFINPVITAGEGTTSNEEGCLSLPDIFGTVKRAKEIHIDALAPSGKKISRDVSGWEAVVMQHEYDHLDGILFVDRLSSLDKLMVKRRIKAIQKLTTEDGDNIRYYPPEED